MRVETITKSGKVFALIPFKDFEQLQADSEMLADIEAYDAARARLDKGEDEVIPFSIVKRRLAGESTVKIWREHRGLTQEKLAKKSKVSRAMIAAIEAGSKKGSITTLKSLARALKVTLDNLS